MGGRIVVVGSYNRDLVLVVERFPRPGETIVGGGLTVAHGGKGSNQAVQAARCGAIVSMIAAIGTDAEGDAVLALWAAEGIDHAAVRRVPDAPTGTALILVDAAGENQIVIVSGANARLDASVATAAPLADAALIVAQLETPVGAVLAAFRAGRAAGARCLLNIAPATAQLPAELLAAADIVVANEGEAALVTGLTGTAGVGALCRALRDRLRPDAVAVVTAGGAGAWLDAPGMAAPLHRPALAVQVVDATGAGDACVGALAARLAAGDGLAQALEAGVAAGSLACRRRGAVPSLPSGAELTAALAG